jgi:hypothetical protein
MQSYLVALYRQRDARRAIANLNAVDRIGLAHWYGDPQEMLSEHFEPLLLCPCVPAVVPHFEH